MEGQMAMNFFLKPIGVLPMPMPMMPINLSPKMLLLFGCMLFGLLLGFIYNRHDKNKEWQTTDTLNLIIPTLASGALFLMFGISMISLKGLIFLFLLLIASNSDFKNREVTDWIPIAIAITALIGTRLADIPFMLIAMLIIGLPQLLIAMLKPGGYGGADIKLMAACSFLLGIEGGFIAIILGLSVGLIATVIKRKLKHENLKEKFPVVPCLALGSFLAFLII